MGRSTARKFAVALLMGSVLLPEIMAAVVRPEMLRVMSFNIWMSGSQVDDGIYKIVKHIKLVDPDIVALQEVDTPATMKKITDKLGGSWMGHQGAGVYSDVGILTKHKILTSGQAETVRNVSTSDFDKKRFNTTQQIVHRNSGIGTQILLKNGLIVSVWDLHLDWRSYGPDAANNKLVTKKEQILMGEDNGTPLCRTGEVREVVDHEVFQQAMNGAEEVPVILCGDFNAPSHQDWVEENKGDHGGWVVEWPATKVLTDEVNMIDSYRRIHPDPVKQPGLSWSPVQKFMEDWSYTVPMQQDRVDFLFYRGSRLEPIDSFMYAGTEELKAIPNQRQNDYPSDHYAIVTDFAIRPAGMEFKS